MSDPVQLLRIPDRFGSVDAVLETALKMSLSDVLILSQREDGALVFLHSDDMTVAHTNWMLDQAKQILFR